ncbi:antitoxin VbhA family protein [Pseudomonas sp. GD03860]|uniref:antitoxin VbhA family protein n=1 Tax=Pseudomonas TaxID=286 RepID=UPI002363B9E2|nr:MULTISPECIES: antitoxin VbhA family protein [Pseudomonas]MDD2059118.1 antitoxin VbhA family protein [Pseudomonas putida]MDH0638940.1 antitoxin VbhA family protein [Pseudomonas sp. GD03860]
MSISEDERERRRKAVAAEIACLTLDGGQLAAERVAQLQRYIDGEVSLEQLRAELIERLRLDDEGIADEDEIGQAWGTQP